ncbi:KR domain-containing protein [Xylariales sp. PMI_506]|nr:KR domain-containing protein [Xylariales sp. PMI_506]
MTTATPIAVCGIALRLPGDISTPAEFWDLLVNKKDARGPIPERRLKIANHYSKSGKHGYFATDHGYFLGDSVELGALDSTLFSMAKAEIERSDPQQRMLLELTRECFESAGETDYRGKGIGTFVGSFGQDWEELFVRDSQIQGLYKVSGHGDFVLSNRISYEYDLKGPSMTIRTGCSSSLICLHQACLSIRSGESDSAIVAGSNLIMAPGMTKDMSEQGVLSPDGSSRSFDADANGYARGEAVNMVYIKRLSDALRDGNPIRAIIRATSSNADGKTAGLSVPNFESHEMMIRKAYETAGISDLSATAFVECHGTGTQTGDPIEIKAVAKVFGDHGVHIGSVKPNVGHSEGASGLSSLIKAILALEHQTIPPNIKFKTPNPKIPFKERKLVVPIEPTPWPADRAERVSVNSFGIGGANAHVVIDSARSFLGPQPAALNGGASNENEQLRLMVFSASTSDSLRRQVVNNQLFLDEHPALTADVAYTLGARRDHLQHRAFSVVGSFETNTSSFSKIPGPKPELVMIFTGQGAQWAQMGAELLNSTAHPTFAQSIHLMDKALSLLPDSPSWSIFRELMKPTETSNLSKASISQPLCTAVQIALVDTLARYGVRPYAVVGHSSGEMAAAYAAGRLTSNEAITAAYYRGIVSGEVQKCGGMAAIGMGWDEVKPYLTPGVVIACENSPSSVTISGDKDRLGEVLTAIKNAQPSVLARELKVDKAYHSEHMKEVGARYNALASPYVTGNSIKATSSAIMFSSVTGTQISESDSMGASYWRSNLESPVLFRTAVANLVDYHNSVSKQGLAFLEVGPHSALAGPLRQTLAQASLNSPYSSCLLRGKHAVETLLSAIGQLWQQGIDIDFDRLLNGRGSCKVVPELPSYPWQHDQVHLFETRVFKATRFPSFRRHELLGERIPESTDNEPVWRSLLSLDNGDVIFPCAGYIGMVGEAARQLSDDGYSGFSVRGMVIDTAMVVPLSKSTEIITSLTRYQLTDSLDSAWWSFVISSHNGSSWTKHCSGQVCAQTNDAEKSCSPSKHLPRRVKPATWYQTMRNVGGNYGPYFQGLSDVACSTTDYCASGTALHTVQDDEEFYAVHPTKIDFFLQLFGVAAFQGIGHSLKKMIVPTYIERMDVNLCSEEFKMNVKAVVDSRGGLSGGGSGIGPDGRIVMKVKGANMSPLEVDESEEIANPHAGARIHWHEDFDFVNLSDLVKPNATQMERWPDCREYTAICIRDALQKLNGIDPSAPHLQKFLVWMRKQPLPQTNASADDLYNSLTHTEMGCVIHAMKQVLDNIVAIFKGEAEPIEVLMQDGILTDFYQCVNWSERKGMFQLLAHYKPNMRILEIGAGTGGTTHVFLSNIINESSGQLMYSDYMYTDISAGFFGAAQERFKGYPNMRFQALDISKDPIEQGFEANSYDLIISSNCLHATPSLVETLTNVRKLLRPDGRLFLEELVSDVKLANFVMGVLPGWWLGDADGRPDEPYASPERWDHDLRKAGFDGLEKVALDCPEPNHLNAFLMAKPAAEKPIKKFVTLLHDQSSIRHADILRQQLVSCGFQVDLREDTSSLPRTSKDVISILDLEAPFFENVKPEKFALFQNTVSAISKADGSLFWLTRPSQMGCSDPRWAQIVGAARSIRNDLGIAFATCEIDDINSEETYKVATSVFEKFWNRRDGEELNPEYEYAIKDGRVFIPRVYPCNVLDEIQEVENGKSTTSTSAQLTIGKPGRLNTFHWISRSNGELREDEVRVEPRAVGMNFRDILMAMGIIGDIQLGLETAGIAIEVGTKVTGIRPGDRVLVMGGYGFSTALNISETFCVKIPDTLAFVDAATMPAVFCTVIYGLLDVGRLEPGQSILIHSACGGVGIAAIQIAKMIGAEIYCTVSSEEKTQFLESTFGIPRSRIFYSRDTSFLPALMAATNNCGVDVVLNSLSGELLHTSWECVAEFGKMIEIGKRDLLGNGRLALNPFLLNRGYHCVDLAHLLIKKPKEANRLMKTLMKLYEEGHIEPIRPVKVFPIHEVADCFLYMQKGQHIGKIVVNMELEQDQSLSISKARTGDLFLASASYLLIGGLGGLGRVVANWMIQHGARHLVFLSRSAGQSEDDQAFLDELRSQGCSATVISGSVTVLGDVQKAVAAAPRPLKGIMNMSMVLRDQIFGNMTHEEWTAAVAPKVQGTWNLHEACMNEELDFFVLFSSISSTAGQRGQANYASANSFLDTFVHYRQGQGLPAASINVGVMLDHGYVAENEMLRERLIAQGGYGIKIPELLDTLTLVTLAPQQPTPKEPFVTPAQLAIGLSVTTPLTDPSNRVTFKGDRRFAIYYNSSGGEVTSNKSGTSSKLAEFIASATSDPFVLMSASSVEFLARHIAMQLLALLLRPVEDESEIDVSRSLQDIGLDSLVAIEMRSWWKTTFQFDISVLEMLGIGSILALGERAAEGLRDRFGGCGQQGHADEQNKVDLAQHLAVKMP